MFRAVKSCFVINQRCSRESGWAAFFNNFIYLFIDCPGCSFCCVGFPLVALSGGYPLVVGCGLLVAGHRVQVKGLQ